MINQKTFNSLNPKIYLVATPIGNLADFSFRAVEVLKEVAVIFCEDTRTSKVLLTKYQISTPTQSLHKFNETTRLEMIGELIQKGASIALISDAGVPVISDPGAKIVQLVRQNYPDQADVTAIGVGPAYLHALIPSGFLGEHHYFYGFLKNRQTVSKLQELNQVLGEHLKDNSLVFYESVHRIKKTLATLGEILPPTHQILLGRELTKINEQILIGSIQEINDFVNSEEFVEKGEFVVVVDQQLATEKTTLSTAQIVKEMNHYLVQGLKLKQAAQIVGLNLQMSANEIYQIFVKSAKNF